MLLWHEGQSYLAIADSLARETQSRISSGIVPDKLHGLGKKHEIRGNNITLR